MKKILSFTLVSLALAALAAPAYAGKFGGSVRGDVGALDSQVPFFGVNNIIDSTAYSAVNTTEFSKRKDWNWDFTGRLFWYVNCSPCDPCPVYIAASWQGSDHKVNTVFPAHVETKFSQAIIPMRANGKSGFLNANGTITVLTGGDVTGTPVVEPVPSTITTYDTVFASVAVENEFSKAKLGVGFDLYKKGCLKVSMEIGGNYLNAKLITDKLYDLSVPPTPASFTTTGTSVSPVITQTGNRIVAPTFSANLGIPALGNSNASGVTPADAHFFFFAREKDETEGLGLYASIKGEYAFPSTCFGSFGVYGKAEVSDIIGRQTYHYDMHYNDVYGTAPNAGRRFDFQEDPQRRYNNIVEVDLEAAVVYSPTFKCWDDLDMSIAFGIRTDSFVNLFAHPTYENNQSILNLTRPSLFIEIGLKA